MTAQPQLFAPHSKLQLAFEEFDSENPAVWSLFVRFMDEARSAGHQRLSADAILHRVRWDMDVITRGGHGHRINNNFSAFYSCKYARLFPSRAGLFEMRKRREAQGVAS